MILTFYLFNKLFRNKPGIRGKSIFSFIVISGIAIGITSLLIALSVLNGFQKVLSEKLSDLDSHLQIIGFSDYNLDETEKNASLIRSLLGDNFQSIDVSVSKAVIISSSKVTEGVSLRGVAEEYFLRKKNITIKEGDKKLDGSSVIIGVNLAKKMKVAPGDKISLFYLAGIDRNITIEDGGIEQFTVSGLFETGMSKYDDNFIYTEINRARELFNIPANQASIMEVKLKDVSRIDSITTYLQDELTYPYYVRNIYEINRNIFTWIELQQKPIPLVLGLITLVAAFNIISTVLMTVLEKTRRIGIMRSLGFKKTGVSGLFLLFGSWHGLLGTVYGNLLALLLIFIQKTFNVITLPSSIYFVSEVPLEIVPETFLFVSVGSIVLNILMSLIPSVAAARISPLSAIRFK
ncbi:MAG: ABC transporter permease [Ignavibacteriaceae bacterium]|nr:ABC transporter permease [Ignavibacteriaceae bacterium]